MKVLKYILINAGFTVAGLVLSFIINLAEWLGLDHPHDMGLGNLFLTTSVFAILGFVYTGIKFSKNKTLVAVSAIAVLCLVLFLGSLFILS